MVGNLLIFKGRACFFIIVSAVALFLPVPVYSQTPSPTASASAPPNLVSNSSFEIIDNVGWGMHNVGKFTDTVFAHDSDCHSGHSCLKFNFRGANTNYSQLSHAFIPVDPNKTYTMSAYFKASKEVHGASLQAWFENGGIANQGCGINLTTSWQKVSITFTPGYFTTCGSYTHANSPAHFVSPFISFVPQAGTGVDYSIFIDDVQLTEGSSAIPYQPTADLEYNLSSNQTANIFTLSDPQPAKLLLNVHKYTPGAINFNGNLQIIDPTGPSEIIVATVPVSIDRAPDNFGNFQTEILLPATLNSGFYQAALLEGSAAPLATISFGILPPIKTLTSDQSSFGGHYTPTADNIAFAQKMGEKWARALDFTGMFLWQLVEPAEGSFDFSESDREVNSLLTAGIQPLGLLYGNPPWAANMVNDKTNFKRQLIAYTQATVNHYKDKIKYWEVWNESYNWTLTADFADILKDVYQTIKTTCPDCQVLGINFSAMLDPGVQGVGNFIKGGGVNFSDLINAHFYPCCSGATPDSYLQSYIDGNFCGLGPDSVYYSTEWFSFDSEECQKGLNAPGQVLNGKRYYDNRGVRTIFKVDKPLWMSESGIISHSLYDPNNNNTEGCQPCTPPYSFKEAARYISQYYAIALGNGMKRLFYYYNAGSAAEPYAPNSMPMREYDGALKPIAIAYAMVERMLDGLTPTAKTETENFKAMTFSDSQNNKTHVVWLKQGKSGTLKFSTPIIKTSMYGKSENVPANTDITLSEDPIYIQGVDTIPVTKIVSEVSTLNKQLFGQSYYGPFSGTVNLDLSTLTPSSNSYDLPITIKYSDDTSAQKIIVIKFNLNKPSPSVQPSLSPMATSSANFIKAQDDKFLLNNHEFLVKGVNFAPQSYNWNDLWFGADWDEAKIDQELSLAESMGANTVRVMVGDSYVLKRISRTIHSTMNETDLETARQSYVDSIITKLNTFLTKADNYHLKVLVSLFPDMNRNWMQDTEVLNDQHLYLDSVINHFKDDPRIFAWEVFNEFFNTNDPDVPKIIGWLTNIVTKIRSLDSNHLVGVGGSDINHFLNLYNPHNSLNAITDYIGIHRYPQYDVPGGYQFRYNPTLDIDRKDSSGNFLDSAGDLTNLKTSFPNKPIFLEEIGLLTNGTADSENAQKRVIQDLCQSINRNQPGWYKGLMIWTIRDTPSQQWGLYKADFSPKPAAEIFKNCSFPFLTKNLTPTTTSTLTVSPTVASSPQTLSEVVIKTISTAPVPDYPSGSSGQNNQPDKTTGANRYDLNGDGVINSFDFAILLKDWRRGTGSTKEDFNHDGVINSFDYSVLKKAVSKQL